MWSEAQLCLVFLCSLVEFQGQALVFDVFRNYSALTSQDICASLACSVEDDNKNLYDIHQVISLTISEIVGDQNTWEPIAGLSFFNVEIHLYKHPSHLSGTGQLFTKSGKLNVVIKKSGLRCLSDAVMCELRFINSKNKGQVIKVEKKLQRREEVVKSTANNVTDSGAFKELRDIITEEIHKIGRKVDNITNNVESVVKLETQRFLQLKGVLNEDLHTSLNILDQKLNNLETALNEQVTAKVNSFSEIFDNRTDLITSLITDRFNTIEDQVRLLEVTLRSRSASTDNSMNELLKRVLSYCTPCKDLQTNLSNILQNQLTIFKAEAVGKVSTTDNLLETFGGSLSTRSFMEAIARMTYNISEAKSKLNQLRTDLSTEIKTVHSNISSLQETMSTKHDRITREVNDRINNIDTKLTNKFLEFEEQKRSFATLNTEIQGKLLNFEINLKNFNVVMRNIKRIFEV